MAEEDAKGVVAQADGGGDTQEGEASATVAGGAQEIASKSTAAGVQQCRGDGTLVTSVHRFAGQ